MNLYLERKWINQPSSAQPYHHLHGVNVLAIKQTARVSIIYFLKGDVISQEILTSALSDGWKDN